MKSDTRECSSCHDRSSLAARAARRHNYDGIDLSEIKGVCVRQFDLGHH